MSHREIRLAEYPDVVITPCDHRHWGYVVMGVIGWIVDSAIRIIRWIKGEKDD